MPSASTPAPTVTGQEDKSDLVGIPSSTASTTEIEGGTLVKRSPAKQRVLKNPDKIRWKRTPTPLKPEMIHRVRILRLLRAKETKALRKARQMSKLSIEERRRQTLAPQASDPAAATVHVAESSSAQAAGKISPSANAGTLIDSIDTAEAEVTPSISSCQAQQSAACNAKIDSPAGIDSSDAFQPQPQPEPPQHGTHVQKQIDINVGAKAKAVDASQPCQLETSSATIGPTLLDDSAAPASMDDPTTTSDQQTQHNARPETESSTNRPKKQLSKNDSADSAHSNHSGLSAALSHCCKDFLADETGETGGDKAKPATPNGGPEIQHVKPIGFVDGMDGINEAFGFWDHALDVLVQGQDEDDAVNTLEGLANSLQEDSLSTAFSGIRSPETAMALLRNRLSSRLGREVANQNGRLQHSIEWNSHSQAECLVGADLDDSCVFGDIAQFYVESIRSNVLPELLNHPAMAIAALTPLIMSGRAVQSTGFCLRHNKSCALKTCRRHIAGTSCKPFSRRGAGLGVCDGDILYTLSWVALRRLLQESDVTQENVRSFPVKVIADLLSDLYHVDSCVMEAIDFGSPCARARQFIRLRHKVKILSETTPLSRFAQRFHRMVNFHWSQ